LFQQNGQWHVFKIVAGKAVNQAITLSDKGPLQSVVTEGLSAGDTVINYPGDRLKNGSPVKAM